jgi:hypothetical protein
MFIEQAYKGKPEVWKYIIGAIGIFFGSQLIGGIPLLIAMFLKSSETGIAIVNQSQLFSSFEANPLFFMILLPFVVGLVMLFLWFKILHRQSITTLTTARNKISWKRILFSFLLWGSITVVLTLLDYSSNPQNYEWNFELSKFIWLFVIAVLMVPIQTSFEEYLFRGYLMQGIGFMSKNRWLPLILTSVIFGLMHIANPEVEKIGYIIMVYYIGTGFFLGIMTLMDDGLELALGFHAANNLITALLVTANWTAFQTNSILKDTSEPAAGLDVLVPVFIVFPILLFIFSKVYKWKNWKEKLTGKVVEPDHELEEIGRS